MSRPQKNLLYRLLEIFPGACTWLTFVAAIIFSYFKPAWVAFFIILFDLYWLMKAVNIAFHLIFTYRKISLHSGYDWLSRCEGLAAPDELARRYKAQAESETRKFAKQDLAVEIERLELLSKTSSAIDYKKLLHAILLPTVDESADVLFHSIDSYLASSYPEERMVLVLACEQRSGKFSRQVASAVLGRYAGRFRKILTTFHPDGVSGEARTKGANITFAARELRQYLDAEKIRHEDVIVSAFDADTVVNRNYFAQLSYVFLTSPDPLRASYQPIPLYNNNVWDAPAFNRLVSINSSFWQMVESSRSDRLVTFSSHSMSFKTLVEVDFWPVDVVSEDSQIFWRCFLHYDGNYRTEPLFTAVSLDAVVLGSYAKSLAGQYKQNRRWAWGIVDFPYLINGFRVRKSIPFWKKFLYGYRLFEGHYFWATASVIIAFLGWLPLFFGTARFENQVLANNLPHVTGTIMTVSTLFLIFFVILYFSLLPKSGDRKGIYSFSMFAQWILVPVSSIVFGSIPAIDAQTRLLLGKYMEFWVTPKIRKDAGITTAGDNRPIAKKS